MDVLNALALIGNFVIVPGLTYGSQLALGALGVTMVYAILRFSNFSHGELMSFGAMITILTTWGLQSAGVDLGFLPTALLALPVGIAGTILLAMVTDRLVFRFYRAQKSSPLTFLIASLGVMFVLGGVVRFVIGPEDQQFNDGTRFLMKARDFKEMTGLDQGIAIKMSQAITVGVTVVLVIALFWFLNRTRTGKSMRAYSNNEDLALLSGINPERVVTVCWLLTAALAAIAGTLYGLDKSYKPFTFLMLLLPIFASAIVGGIGNPVGAVLGGYVIAFSELFVTFAYKRFLGLLLPNDWVPDGLVQFLSTDYKFAVSFLLLVLVLLFRPTGIMRGQSI